MKKGLKKFWTKETVSHRRFYLIVSISAVIAGIAINRSTPTDWTSVIVAVVGGLIIGWFAIFGGINDPLDKTEDG